jgi:hypothetical protein
VIGWGASGPNGPRANERSYLLVRSAVEAELVELRPAGILRRLLRLLVVALGGRFVRFVRLVCAGGVRREAIWIGPDAIGAAQRCQREASTTASRTTGARST